MANTRPYTREELKSLRRANLQNLFKIHNLKGANGTNNLLIDTLVDYFASPTYREAHPPPPYQPTSSHPSLKSSTTRPPIATKVESRYKGLAVPANRPLAGGRRVISAQGGPQQKRAGNGLISSQIPAREREVFPTTQAGRASGSAAQRTAASSASAQAGPSRSAESEETRVDDGRVESPGEGVDSGLPLPSLPAAPIQPITDQHSSLSVAHIEALIQASNSQWQERISSIERSLGEQVEKLREELEVVKAKYEELDARLRKGGEEKAVQPGRPPKPWSPWEGRPSLRAASDAGPSRSTNSKSSQTPTLHSTSHAPSTLGKRRMLDSVSFHEANDSDDQHERGEPKRVRFDGREGNQQLPSEFRTPSPKKGPSTFGPGFFARPDVDVSASHAVGLEQSLVLPRTPSPSRQGVIPDNSQTPRLPNTWREEEDMENEGSATISASASKGRPTARAPMSVAMAPEFSSTPEPPQRRPISPTVERSVSVSSDKLTPGRIMISLPSSTPASSELGSERRDARRADLVESIPLSTVTDLERIDESVEMSSRPIVSPAGRLRFPVVMNTTPSSSTPKRAPPHLSLLAPPALISRGSRAGSELPTLSRALSPPPRPRSASAIHGASTPPRHTFPLNLPTFEQPKVRSASADYMHVAMHGLEDDGLGTFGDEEGGAGVDAMTGSAIGGIWSGIGTEGDLGRARSGRLGKRQEEVVTPGHRTMLGTERYNDTRFGDIPVGMWESPKVDLSGPETPF
ncbi:hypothetical protein CI109_100028 [Kwoniella shandongensis]|uniref:Uncharacterized protein n=1 Tax=Kwoniella shandongensis TaxID=1734106 RepID=A0A5M6BU08_9TREE|nr:uncharacterized protein CI109_005999 [Kwoniella shandongensis]KAA5525691.1 hypothetical protein CI109_005999 [Kwoniella shandongensis]